MKWMSTACVVVALALVVRAQMPDSEEEPELYRCNRQLCGRFCPLGFVTDEDTCPLCECLEDPCKAEGVCAQGETCEARNTCTEHPCQHQHVEAHCIPAVACPMPMCMDRCELGYKNDEHGCMTCQCNEEEEELEEEEVEEAHPCEGYECPISHVCMPIPEDLPQHMVEEVLGRLEAICIHTSQVDAFLNRFGEGSDSDEGDDDDSDESDELLPPEPIIPMPGLCHQLMEQFRHGDTPSRRPYEHLVRDNCHDDGSFKPVQCDDDLRVCWCVDDTGRRIPDTEMEMGLGDMRRACQQHRTFSTDLVIVFEHDIVDEVEEHLEALKKLIVRQLSEWTGLEEAYIQLQAVIVYGEENQYIKVRLRLTTDQVSSLPVITAHLLWNMIHNGFVISYGEATLTPVPEEFFTNHHSFPMDLIEEPRDIDSDSWEDSDETYSSRCGRIWRAHRGLLVVAGVGGGIFLIVILLLIASCVKRRFAVKAQFQHEKMDNYKENLAYTNDMMSSHPDVVISEKPGRADLYKVTLPENQEKY